MSDPLMILQERYREREARQQEASSRPVEIKLHEDTPYRFVQPKRPTFEAKTPILRRCIVCERKAQPNGLFCMWHYRNLEKEEKNNLRNIYYGRKPK